MRVLLDVRGPPGHGCVVHARQLGTLIRRPGVRVVTRGAADVTHAQFTDALWGTDISAAAAAYEDWARTVPRPLVVTLHDVPGGDDDVARDIRRSAGYARVLAGSDGAIVSSRHEVGKVARLGGPPARIIDLPLPTTGAEAGASPAWVGRTPTIGVLGFLFPGKGHLEVIDAAARRPEPWQVVSLGAVSPGHEPLRRHLTAHATHARVELLVTGHLSDRAMGAAVDAVTVPVVANRVVSTSGSLMAWIAGLRRPLVADGEFSRDFDDGHPGLITRYGDADELTDLLHLARCDPARTRLPQRPTWPDIGAAHLDAYADLLAGTRGRP